MKKMLRFFACATIAAAAMTATSCDKEEQSESVRVTVTFDSQGGSAVPSQEVVVGRTLTKPNDPTKEGLYFAGWYKEKECINAWNFEEPVAAAMTLYAKWLDEEQAVKGTFSFEGNIMTLVTDDLTMTLTYEAKGNFPVGTYTGGEWIEIDLEDLMGPDTPTAWAQYRMELFADGTLRQYLRFADNAAGNNPSGWISSLAGTYIVTGTQATGGTWIMTMEDIEESNSIDNDDDLEKAVEEFINAVNALPNPEDITELNLVLLVSLNIIFELSHDIMEYAQANDLMSELQSDPALTAAFYKLLAIEEVIDAIYGY